jgi:hypothetical protein
MEGYQQGPAEGCLQGLEVERQRGLVEVCRLVQAEECLRVLVVDFLQAQEADCLQDPVVDFLLVLGEDYLLALVVVCQQGLEEGCPQGVFHIIATFHLGLFLSGSWNQEVCVRLPN